MTHDGTPPRPTQPAHTPGLPPLLAEHLEHFGRRVVLDAFQEATGRYWRHRAQVLEWARPRLGDYTGHATPSDLEERDQELADAALACRRHADLIADIGLDQETHDLIDRQLGAGA